MVDRTPYRQQKTGQHQNTMTRKEEENNGGHEEDVIGFFVLILVTQSV